MEVDHPAVAANRAFKRERRMRRFARFRRFMEIAAAALFWITPVQGAPLAGFFAGLAAGALLPGAAIGFEATAYGIGIVAGQFIAANWVTIALIGASLLIQAFNQPSQTASVFNSKVAIGPRRHAFGKVKVGGQILFWAFKEGALWVVIVHCDEDLLTFDHYRLDDLEVAVDVDHRVTTDAFKAESGFILKSRNPFFSLWTQTYTPADPTPPPLAVFKAACPEWTDDHKLVGTTYSVMKIDPVDKDTKGSIYKWAQSGLGNGVPGLTLVGWFGRAYDPRDENQDIDDESTWLPTRNSALAWAWNRYRPHGFETPMAKINWDLVAAAADICDGTVADKNDVGWPRYACGLTFDEDKSNAQVEQMILATCDGMVLYDATGKLYCKVGAYEAPTVTFTASRDILGMDSTVVEDGEAQLDGVVVTYTEPDYGYILQPSAPWFNPRYHVDGTIPRLQQVTVEGVQAHNQAVRIAKAIGEMTQPAHKLAPLVGHRALLARRERIVGIAYDDDFTGNYQIAAPVTFDVNTNTGQLAVVPVTANTWTLLPGEEGDRPRRDVVDNDDTIPLLDVANVTIEAIPVAGSNGNTVHIRASFPAPPSATYSYEFEYSVDHGASWHGFATDMVALEALTPVIDATISVLVHWRTVTSGGNYSDYSSNVTVIALAHVTADLKAIRADSTTFTADMA